MSEHTVHGERSRTIGIIGCGGRGPAHAQGWLDVPDTRIVAVADPVLERREALGRQFDIAFRYNDYCPLMEETRPQFLSIATQPNLREPVIRCAAEYGVRGVLCEKPLALSLDEVDRILAVCRENNIALVVNHQMRHMSDWQWLAGLARSGNLGPLEMIEAFSYGNLMAQGTHLLDMVLCFAGDQEPEWVLAQTEGWEDQGGHPAPALSLAHFRFPGNLARQPVPRSLGEGGSFSDGWLPAYVTLGSDCPRCVDNREQWFHFQLRVIGREGYGIVNLQHGARVWRRGQSEWEVGPVRWSDDASLAAAQAALSASVIRAAEDPAYDPPASGARAKIGYQMLEAICASALAGERIRWPLPAWSTSPLQTLGERMNHEISSPSAR